MNESACQKLHADHHGARSCPFRGSPAASLHTWSWKLLPDPGPELADDSVFVHVCAQGHEVHQLRGGQAREGTAEGADGILAIFAEKIAGQRFPFTPSDFGDAHGGLDGKTVER